MQLAEVDLGRQRSPEHEDGEFMVSYLRSANIGDGVLLLDDVKQMNFTPREQTAFALQSGDVLVTEGSGSRSAVGQSAVWRADLPGVICFQNTVLRIRARQARADGRFLAWWARYAHAAGLMATVASGANILHLSAEELRRLPVPDLDLQRQRRIADFLDDQIARIDKLLAARRKQVDLIIAEMRSQHSERIVALLASEPTARLRRFYDSIEQGASPDGDAVSAMAGEFGVLKTSAIQQGRFIESENKYLSDSARFEERFEVRSEDVLIVRGSGSADLVADVAEVRLSQEHPRLMLSDLTYRLVRLKLVPAYLTAVLLSAPLRMQIRAVVRQGSGPAKARGEDIANLVVPALAEASQKTIAEEYAAARRRADEHADSINRSVALLAELKRSLITAAVCGEFDVSTADGSRVPVA